MKSFTAKAAAALTAFAVGAFAGNTVTTTCTVVSVSTCTATVTKTATVTTTAVSTLNLCTPISTVVTPCSACSPATVTAWTQPVTWTKSSSVPTSTYCSTTGYYTECACSVTTPQWIYYEQPCEVEYSCPYFEYEYINPKVVTCVVYVHGKPWSPITETWSVGPTGIIKPTAIVTYIPAPTIIVINDITIDVTVAPTYITYTSSVTATVTTTATVAPTGTPVSTFKLAGTFNGEEVVILQEGGSLVVAPATNDTTGVAFTLTSTGDLMASGGGYVSVTFANDVGGPFTYGGLAKRAIADGTYFGVFSVAGSFSLTIDGSSVTIQVCSGNFLSGGDGLMNGCESITLTATPVEQTFPSSTPISSAAPSSVFSRAPTSSAPVSNVLISSAPSWSPSGSAAPTSFSGSLANSAPANLPSSVPTSFPLSASDLPISISIPLSDLPSSILSELPSSILSELPSASPSSNLTVVRRAEQLRGRRFKYAE